MNPESLRKMNEGKIGRRFKFSSGLISAAFAVKCILRFGYRQVGGFISKICEKIHKPTPDFRTIWWRMDRMKNEGVKFMIQEGKHRVVAIDSTGLRPVNDGSYRAIAYGLEREFVKFHIVVDVKTKEILNVKVTKGRVHDNPQFKRLIRPIASTVSAVFADKAYDAVETFEFCRGQHIFPGIPVKLNATNSDGGNKSKIRREMIESQLGRNCKPGYPKSNLLLTEDKMRENQRLWKLRVGYGRRSTIESSFSRYKRILGENLFSKKYKNIEKEIVAKVNVLNRFATN